jgi:hypothetical protein
MVKFDDAQNHQVSIIYIYIDIPVLQDLIERVKVVRRFEVNILKNHSFRIPICAFIVIYTSKQL